MKQFNSVLRLRRDNDYNYKKVEDSFIPADGEICLVDTSTMGLVAVCGDGKTLFKDLEYINQLVMKGYYIDNLFYKDMEKTEELKAFENVIYLDLRTHKIYFYNGLYYHDINVFEVPNASAVTPGIMKLYSTTGMNEDGTMTQRAITDELDDKIEVALNIDEELLIFTN